MIVSLPRNLTGTEDAFRQHLGQVVYDPNRNRVPDVSRGISSGGGLHSVSLA